MASEISFVSSSWFRTSSIVASTLSTLLEGGRGECECDSGVHSLVYSQLAVNALENIGTLLHCVQRLLVHVGRLDRVQLRVVQASQMNAFVELASLALYAERTWVVRVIRLPAILSNSFSYNFFCRSACLATVCVYDVSASIHTSKQPGQAPGGRRGATST